VNGTTITYGTDSEGDKTGQTTHIAGFVYHASPDYTWAAANYLSAGTLSVVTFQATLTSTGDRPLSVSSATATSALASGGTPIKVQVTGISCLGQPLASGSICTISGTYDATAVSADDPITLYDTLKVDVSSNSGIAHEFSTRLYLYVTPNQ
jgi:hypothetical protein